MGIGYFCSVRYFVSWCYEFLTPFPGYSRGAYQVRALAGMIARVSLFPKKCCQSTATTELQRSGYFFREITSKYHCKMSRSFGLYTSDTPSVLSSYTRKQTTTIRAWRDPPVSSASLRRKSPRRRPTTLSWRKHSTRRFVEVMFIYISLGCGESCRKSHFVTLSSPFPGILCRRLASVGTRRCLARRLPVNTFAIFDMPSPWTSDASSSCPSMYMADDPVVVMTGVSRRSGLRAVMQTCEPAIS